MKKVSIVIPAYNCAHLIGRTINSILAQTYDNYEIIIVDDGSTDKTKEVIDAVNDNRIRYFYQENHGGPSKARNKGIDSAIGDYIFIFDADDVMRTQKIELSVAAMENNPQADILFTRFSLISEDDKVVREDYLKEYVTLSNLIGTKQIDDNAYYLKSSELQAAVVKSNFIGTSSVVLRSSALTSSDRFDESLKNADDRLFWIQYAAKHDAIFLNTILHDYRIVSSGLTGQGMLKKGPHKISALEKAKDYCADQALIKLLYLEISQSYLAMSREEKNAKNKRMQRFYAKKSMAYKFNYKAFKLLVASYLPI